MTNWTEQKFAPSPGTFLCEKGEVAEGKVKEFRFGGESPFAFRMFIYNDNGKLKGFFNSCPHFDVPLNHKPDELFTQDGKFFQCVTHYAKFDKSSGLCVEGPCGGESLQLIPLIQEDNKILISRDL